MRSITIIVTILAISIVIPADLLLTGTLTTPQLAEHSRLEDVPKSIVQSPNEPLPIAPEENAPIEPPDQAIILPPKLPEAQPPQQPLQLPQAAISTQNIREGIPSSFILKASLVRIRVASPIEGRSDIRVNLTDSMLVPYPRIREALIDVAARYSPCPAGMPGAGCIDPTADFRFNEQELSSFVQLVNPQPPIEPNRFGDRIERYYSSVITYNGVRYIVSIDMVWTSS